MPEGKVELRRITYNARLSEETAAFAADVWIDGKKVGDVRNDGHGGCNFYSPHTLRNDLQLIAASTLAPEEGWGGEPIPADDETLVAKLLDAFLLKRDLDRLLKSRVLYVDGGSLYQTKSVKDPVMKQRLIEACKAKGFAVLNTLPEAEVLELFKAMTK